MKNILLSLTFVAVMCTASVAQESLLNESSENSTKAILALNDDNKEKDKESGKDEKRKGARIPEITDVHYEELGEDSVKETKFERKIQVGSIIHMFAESQQQKTTAVQEAAPGFERQWERNFNIYRARILLGAQLSPKGNFFMETEIPSIIGRSSGTLPKNVKVSPIILDAQYEHVFNNYFSIIVGKQLVSNNRNGLQGAAALMANDFTHYQYPYNLFETDPLQGNFGRDIGVNTRGFLLKDKLEYRLGMFQGRKFSSTSPYRVVGRVAYNFLDPEKDFYYAGTKLGSGHTFALAGGFDVQSTYRNYGVDAYLDVPTGPGSITVNAAYAYMDGGSDSSAYSFAGLIPKQTVQFLEIGYYFPKLKLQPWFKYENQDINESKEYFGLTESAGGSALKDANILNSNIRLGGGLNYFFNGYNTNVRVSYTKAIYGREDINGGAERASYDQIWLQLQLFIF